MLLLTVLFSFPIDDLPYQDCHVDIANGNYSSILEELEQNDIFKEAFKVSDLFLFIFKLY